jgi:hypothetical protein
MKNENGSAKFAALEEAYVWLRHIYESGPLQMLKDSGMLDGKTMQYYMDNVAYAPFRKGRFVEQNDMDAANEFFLNEVLPSQVGTDAAKIFAKQMGTLGDISDPFVGLLKMAQNIMSMVAYNDAVRVAAEGLLNNNSMYVRSSKTKRLSNGREIPIQQHGKRVMTLLYWKDGKIHGIDTSRAIAEAFIPSKESLGDDLLVSITQGIATTEAMVLTGLNYGFYASNLGRDIPEWVTKMPGATYLGEHGWAKYIATAVEAAALAAWAFSTAAVTRMLWGSGTTPPQRGPGLAPPLEARRRHCFHWCCRPQGQPSRTCSGRSKAWAFS